METVAELRAKIAELKYRHRETLRAIAQYLYEVEGMTIQKIARVMEVAESTVRSLIK